MKTDSNPGWNRKSKAALKFFVTCIARVFHPGPVFLKQSCEIERWTIGFRSWWARPMPKHKNYSTRKFKSMLSPSRFAIMMEKLRLNLLHWPIMIFHKSSIIPAVILLRSNNFCVVQQRKWLFEVEWLAVFLSLGMHHCIKGWCTYLVMEVLVRKRQPHWIKHMKKHRIKGKGEYNFCIFLLSWKKWKFYLIFTTFS